MKRRSECGSPCQLCAKRCPIQAIEPSGAINMDECFYCLDCQVIYYNDKLCLPLIDRRKRREQQLVRGQESRANAPAKNVVVSENHPDDMGTAGQH